MADIRTFLRPFVTPSLPSPALIVASITFARFLHQLNSGPQSMYSRHLQCYTSTSISLSEAMVTIGFTVSTVLSFIFAKLVTESNTEPTNDVNDISTRKSRPSRLAGDPLYLMYCLLTWMNLSAVLASENLREDKYDQIRAESWDSIQAYDLWVMKN